MRLLELEEILKKYNVNDVIFIKKPPTSWSSHFNKNCPLRIQYPYTCKIKQIEIVTFPGSPHIAITDGNYGWCLLSLITNGCLASITEIRKEKLEQIENYEKVSRI